MYLQPYVAISAIYDNDNDYAIYLVVDCLYWNWIR